ncbi:hypothetical protein RB594_002734 [Gaeumannomyces avenae]
MDASGTNPPRERSSSTSSASTDPGSPITPRRNSAGLFASLQEQKRSNDPASIARRQSLHEQRPPPGFIGKLWNNWVYGPSPPK